MKRLIRFKMAVRLGLIVINLPPLLNLNNLFVSETHSKSCAIDSQTKFFSHCSKKIVSETRAKWSQIGGAVSESEGFTNALT